MKKIQELIGESVGEEREMSLKILTKREMGPDPDPDPWDLFWLPHIFMSHMNLIYDVPLHWSSCVERKTASSGGVRCSSVK